METSRPRVIANITLTLDGHTTGSAGADDMSCIAPYAVSDESRDHLVQMTDSMVAVMGRVGYEGFSGYWPQVCEDDAADPRDLTFAQWLDAVDKVVVSSTLNEPAQWKNTRISTASPEQTIRELRDVAEGDIRVLSSASLIRHLLEHDEIDELEITLAPEITAGGSSLFHPDIARSSKWRLQEATASGSGAVFLRYSLTTSGS